MAWANRAQQKYVACMRYGKNKEAVKSSPKRHSDNKHFIENALFSCVSWFYAHTSDFFPTWDESVKIGVNFN